MISTDVELTDAELAVIQTAIAGTASPTLRTKIRDARRKLRDEAALAEAARWDARFSNS